MTARAKTLTVILEEATRDDDIEMLVSAIAHVRGVASVLQHTYTAPQQLAVAVAKSELRIEILGKLMEALKLP